MANKFMLDRANIIDNLTSTSTTDSLSANQGRILNDTIPIGASIVTKEFENVLDPLVVGVDLTGGGIDVKFVVNIDNSNRQLYIINQSSLTPITANTTLSSYLTETIDGIQKPDTVLSSYNISNASTAYLASGLNQASTDLLIHRLNIPADHQLAQINLLTFASGTTYLYSIRVYLQLINTSTPNNDFSVSYFINENTR